MSPLLTGALWKKVRLSRSNLMSLSVNFASTIMCRILWAYFALCAIAVGGYFALVGLFGGIKCISK